jgi:glycopeptide antibiotics resistance protein
MLLALGVILSATLSPLEKEFQGPDGSGTCDLSRIGLPSLAELATPNTDVAANILLFIPLGVSIGLIPGSRRKVAVFVGVLALPVMVESVQLLVTPLHRGCQSADVIDNLTGLAIGLVVGTALRRYVPSVRREVEPVD